MDTLAAVIHRLPRYAFGHLSVAAQRRSTRSKGCSRTRRRRSPLNSGHGHGRDSRNR